MVWNIRLTVFLFEWTFSSESRQRVAIPLFYFAFLQLKQTRDFLRLTILAWKYSPSHCSAEVKYLFLLSIALYEFPSVQTHPLPPLLINQCDWESVLFEGNAAQMLGTVCQLCDLRELLWALHQSCFLLFSPLLQNIPSGCTSGMSSLRCGLNRAVYGRMCVTRRV